MRNNRDRLGRPVFFEGLTPLAVAIAKLPPAKTSAESHGSNGKLTADTRTVLDRFVYAPMPSGFTSACGGEGCSQSPTIGSGQ